MSLLKIQSELKAPKNQFNSFGKYKYRSTEDILEAVKPLLLKYECTMIISDSVQEKAGIIFCETYIQFFDKDGKEFNASASAGIEPNRKGMDIAQSFGASSSYARKYALNGLFLIDDTKDADATNSHGKGAQVQVTNAKPVADKPSSSGTDVMFQKAVDRMKEVGTQAKYDEIMAAIGIQLSESQRNALSKFIKK